jgi:GT2 family glycosyltransferase
MRILILFACYNRCSTTKDFIRDIKFIQNKNKNISILAIDGGSSDGTIDMLRSQSDGVFRFYKIDDNSYWSESMKAGFKMIQTENSWDAIIYCNDDIKLNLSALERFLQVAQNEDLLVGKFKDPITHKKSYGGLVSSKVFPYSFSCINSNNYDSFNGNFVFIKRNLIEKVGFFKDKFKHNKSDILFGLRLRKHGHVIKEYHEYLGTCSRGDDRFKESFSNIKSINHFFRIFNSVKWHPMRERCEFCAFFSKLRFVDCFFMPYIKGLINWYIIKQR